MVDWISLAINKCSLHNGYPWMDNWLSDVFLFVVTNTNLPEKYILGLPKFDFSSTLILYLYIVPLAAMPVPLMWELVVQELQRLWHGKIVQCKAYSHITSVVWFEEVRGVHPKMQFPCILFHQAVCLMHTFFSDRNMLVLEGEHNFDATWVSELQGNGSLVKHLLDFLLSSFI